MWEKELQTNIFKALALYCFCLIICSFVSHFTCMKTFLLDGILQNILFTQIFSAYILIWLMCLIDMFNFWFNWCVSNDFIILKRNIIDVFCFKTAVYVLILFSCSNSYLFSCSRKQANGSFIMACLQIFQGLLSLATFFRVHSNSEQVSYLSWQNTYPNLETTRYIKLKFFLWTELLENILFARYLVSVAAPLNTQINQNRLEWSSNLLK